MSDEFPSDARADVSRSLAMILQPNFRLPDEDQGSRRISTDSMRSWLSGGSSHPLMES